MKITVKCPAFISLTSSALAFRSPRLRNLGPVTAFPDFFSDFFFSGTNWCSDNLETSSFFLLYNLTMNFFLYLSLQSSLKASYFIRTGGSWSTCMIGSNKSPPQDVAHLQFKSRIAFKLVWTPPMYDSVRTLLKLCELFCLLSIPTHY
jgi:hypothetical protein